MPPSTRPTATDPPSIHPSASCLFLQPSGGGRTAAAAPSSNPPALQPWSVGRSVGTLAHTRFLLRAARGKEEEEEEGRCAAHARKPCARTLFPPSFPRSLWGRRPPHNTARLKPYSARSVACSVGRMQKHHHHRLRPPSGSANMAQTDELVLAFAFASASKWGSEIDAEEEGGSPAAGCLPA